MTPAAAIASTSLAFTGAPVLRMHPLGRNIKPIELCATKPTGTRFEAAEAPADVCSEDRGTSIEAMEARLASLTGPENKGKRYRLRKSIERQSMERLAWPSLTVPAEETLEAMEERLASLVGAENKGRRSRLRKSIERRRALSTNTVPSAVAASPFEAVIPLLPKNPSPELPPPEATRAPALNPARTPAPPRYGTAKPAAAVPLGAPRQRQQGRRSPPRARSPERGSSPNVAWRAVSMEELRAHPYFLALPEPHAVFPTCAADLRLYRQDSLRVVGVPCGAGDDERVRAVPRAVRGARGLACSGVPPSLRGRHKALDAHARLQEPALSAYSALAACSAGAEAGGAVGLRPHGARARTPCGSRTPRETTAASHALLAYCARPAVRRGWWAALASTGSVGQIRMAWGSVQEATSLARRAQPLRDAGRHRGGGRDSSPSKPARPRLRPRRRRRAAAAAAWPRGVPQGCRPSARRPTRWSGGPDGRVEPLEVKNHAPFATSRGRYSGGGGGGGGGGGRQQRRLRDTRPEARSDERGGVAPAAAVPAHAVPRALSCRSCLFMSCSATRGANLFRVRRDDALMDAILHFVARFAREYGGAGAPAPPADFFWGDPEYQALLRGASRPPPPTVERVEHIPNERIQRGGRAGRAAVLRWDPKVRSLKACACSSGV